MDKLTQAAFEMVFDKIFSAVKSKHPLFQPGTTLRGILTDWSDTQRGALGTVIGEELATELCNEGSDTSSRGVRDFEIT